MSRWNIAQTDEQKNSDSPMHSKKRREDYKSNKQKKKKMSRTLARRTWLTLWLLITLLSSHFLRIDGIRVGNQKETNHHHHRRHSFAFLMTLPGLNVLWNEISIVIVPRNDMRHWLKTFINGRSHFTHGMWSINKYQFDNPDTIDITDLSHSEWVLSVRNIMN